MKTIHFFLVCFILNMMSFNGLFAQEQGAGTSPVKKNVIILDGDDVNYEGIKSERSTILKTHPIGFYFGWQSIELEQQINDYLSFQAGGGITFKNNFKYSELNLSSEEPPYIYYSDSKNWTFDIPDEYEDDTDHRRITTGYIFSFSSRFYPANDGIDNWFLAPTITVRRNNYEVQGIENNNKNVVYQEAFTEHEALNLTDLTIRIGDQYKNGRFMFEYFIGGGRRFVSSHRIDLGYNSKGFVDQKYVDFSSSEWRFEAGIRIGLKLF